MLWKTPPDAEEDGPYGVYNLEVVVVRSAASHCPGGGHSWHALFLEKRTIRTSI